MVRTYDDAAPDAHCGRKLRMGGGCVKGLAWENFSHRGAATYVGVGGLGATCKTCKSPF